MTTNNGWIETAKELPPANQLVQLVGFSGDGSAIQTCGEYVDGEFFKSYYGSAHFTHWKPLSPPPIIPEKPKVKWLDPEGVLPRRDEPVLFVLNGDVYATVRLGNYDEVNQFLSNGVRYQANLVRAWCPAPELPKEEQK